MKTEDAFADLHSFAAVEKLCRRLLATIGHEKQERIKAIQAIEQELKLMAVDLSKLQTELNKLQTDQQALIAAEAQQQPAVDALVQQVTAMDTAVLAATPAAPTPTPTPTPPPAA